METKLEKCTCGCGLTRPAMSGWHEEHRPEGITDEHLKFLDNLRTSGVTNMFGAGAYVEEEFGVERKEARRIVTYWMETFGKDGR